jgi:carbonic anhydrase
MEYAVTVKKIKLIVVLGHGNCGAINGALDHVQFDNLSSIMDDIKPSVRQDNQVR